jgi:phosphoribosylanthranilate isomerase
MALRVKIRVKICGITQADQGVAIAQLGASALGFICVPGTPRYIAAAQIQAITAQLPLEVDRVGVFLNATLAEIGQTVAIAQLNCVQLHGTESVEFCTALRQQLPDLEVIKALRIRTREDLAQAHRYEPHIHTLLLDAYHPEQAGGTGLTIDWSTLQDFRPACPWLLAGGLNPSNVLTALELAHPDGLDLSSGVEIAPGNKDLKQVAALFAALKR